MKPITAVCAVLLVITFAVTCDRRERPKPAELDSPLPRHAFRVGQSLRYAGDAGTIEIVVCDVSDDGWWRVVARATTTSKPRGTRRVHPPAILACDVSTDGRIRRGAYRWQSESVLPIPSFPRDAAEFRDGWKASPWGAPLAMTIEQIANPHGDGVTTVVVGRNERQTLRFELRPGTSTVAAVEMESRRGEWWWPNVERRRWNLVAEDVASDDVRTSLLADTSRYLDALARLGQLQAGSSKPQDSAAAERALLEDAAANVTDPELRADLLRRVRP